MPILTISSAVMRCFPSLLLATTILPNLSRISVKEVASARTAIISLDTVMSNCVCETAGKNQSNDARVFTWHQNKKKSSKKHCHYFPQQVQSGWNRTWRSGIPFSFNTDLPMVTSRRNWSFVSSTESGDCTEDMTKGRSVIFSFTHVGVNDKIRK